MSPAGYDRSVRERAKRVTLRDVAEKTGLSTAAVSYALRGLQVPVETQERVRAVADRLGYQADPIARALASGKTGYVGVLCGSLSDIWQQNVAAALGRGLLEYERHALIVDASNSPDLERELALQLVEQRVDALIALWANPHAEHWAEIGERTILVSIGDGLPGAVDRGRGGLRQRRRRRRRAGSARRRRAPSGGGADPVQPQHPRHPGRDRHAAGRGRARAHRQPAHDALRARPCRGDGA